MGLRESISEKLSGCRVVLYGKDGRQLGQESDCSVGLMTIILSEGGKPVGGYSFNEVRSVRVNQDGVEKRYVFGYDQLHEMPVTRCE